MYRQGGNACVRVVMGRSRIGIWKTLLWLLLEGILPRLMAFERYEYPHVDPVPTMLPYFISPTCWLPKWRDHTKVSKEVFPEPLGPTRRNDDKVVEEVERYITKCRKRGIEITTRAVRTIAKGVGCRSVDNKLCESDQAMTAIHSVKNRKWFWDL